MNPKYAPLFESVALPNGITLKNRIVLAPMTHMSSNPDGTVSDAELEYYARRTGGAGMSVTRLHTLRRTALVFRHSLPRMTIVSFQASPALPRRSNSKVPKQCCKFSMPAA